MLTEVVALVGGEMGKVVDQHLALLAEGAGHQRDGGTLVDVASHGHAVADGLVVGMRVHHHQPARRQPADACVCDVTAHTLVRPTDATAPPSRPIPRASHSLPWRIGRCVRNSRCTPEVSGAQRKERTLRSILTRGVRDGRGQMTTRGSAKWQAEGCAETPSGRSMGNGSSIVQIS